MTLDATTATLLGAVIGFAGAILGAMITALVNASTQGRLYARQDGQVRKTVHALYRNACMQFDGTMRIGYLDQPGRFAGIVEMLVGRVSKDDIATAFGPEQTELILQSIPALLDGLHGCMQAQAVFLEAGGGEDQDDLARAHYAESVRNSAGVALAMCLLVLDALGDRTTKPYLPNLHRIQGYMVEEDKRKRAEEERDADII